MCKVASLNMSLLFSHIQLSWPNICRSRECWAGVGNDGTLLLPKNMMMPAAHAVRNVQEFLVLLTPFYALFWHLLMAVQPERWLVRVHAQ